MAQPARLPGGPWHCDAGPHVPRPEGVPWDDRIPYPVFAVAAHVYLQDCRAADGPTAVVPGSHRSGRLAPFDHMDDRGACRTTAGRRSLFEVEAGDVALFVSDALAPRPARPDPAAAGATSCRCTTAAATSRNASASPTT